MRMPNLTLEKLSHVRSHSKWIFSCLVIGLFGYLFSQGSILAPDSGEYLDATLLRSPGYPLFIKFMNAITADYARTLLLVVQLILGFLATFVLAKTFQKLFNLPRIFFSILTGVLLIPYLGKTGNYVLTEGLAYPLFLFSVHFLLKGLTSKNNRSLSLYFIFISALVLTRGQFWFMYVIGVIGLICSFQYNKNGVTRVFLSLLLVSSLFFSYAFDKLYHKLYHGVSTPTPFTGIHLFVQPLYLSNSEDAVLFSDPRERDFFREVRQKMEERKMSYLFSVGYIDAPYHLYTNFDEIIYHILYPALSQHKFLDAVEVDTRLKKMATTLILNQPLAWFKLYTRNVTSHLGGYYHSVILLFLLIGSFLYYLRYRHTLSLCAWLFSLMVVGNSLLVALVQALHVRYTFYTDGLLCCLFLAMLYQGLRGGSHQCKT